MKGVQCYELFGGIALKNHAYFYICVIIFQQTGRIFIRYYAF